MRAAHIVNLCDKTGLGQRERACALCAGGQAVEEILNAGCDVLGFLFVQVFSMFLETLVDFIIIHKDDLQDWLFVLLTQLLKKMGADLLGSVQAKVQKALDVTR